MHKYWIAIITIALVISSCVRTPEFTDAQGNVIPGSIASMEMLDIGGVHQSVWFRGVSVNNPILILLHGGPGASESNTLRLH